jgi:LysM repeat protein
MRPIITVTAVVLLHLCVIAVLVGVNGCRSTTGLETDGDAVAYAAGGRATPAAVPAPVGGLPASSLGAAPAPVPAGKLVTPAPTKLTPIAPVGPGGTYVVAKGETVSLIAAREKIGYKELCDANGLPYNAVLRQGQKLKIPAAGSTAKKTTASSAKPTTSAKPAPAAPAVELTPLKLVPVGTQPAAPAAPAAPASPAPVAVPAKK